MLKCKSIYRLAVVTLWLIAVMYSTPVYAAPPHQVEEFRTFDAYVFSDVRGQLVARDCRTGEQVRFTDIHRFPNPPRPNRYYHFENALVWEGDPGVLYILEIESPKLRWWEISGCPSAPPVPKPVPAPAQISFSVDQDTIVEGQCTNLRWDVRNVRAVYLDGQGVTGQETRQVCPSTTTTYTLRIVTSGDEYRSVTVAVVPRRETPSFWIPVNGVGEGIDESVGSIMHRGADRYAIDYVWEAFEGIDVYPTLQGEVVFSDYVDDYGCTVVIRHSDDRWDKKYYSIYAHLQCDDMASMWDWVDGTRPIGHMGRTGNGSNDIIHLHFAVRSSDGDYDGTDALYGVGQSAFNVRPFMR